MKQIPLAIGPEPSQTFENFLPGANAATLAHLLALAPGAAGLSLGPEGERQSPSAPRAGRTCRGARPAGGVVLGGDGGAMERGRRAHCLFDDAHAFDAAQRQAAFSLFVEATGRGAGVIAAGSVPPVDLAVREDLRTRFGWGHVFALAPLGDNEVRAALRREADRRGTFLSDEVMDYLLNRFARDLKHLMAQLDRLDEFSLANKRAITVPLLKQMLAEEGRPG